MEIDTTALQCFVSVAEMGSFTKASQRVSRSQSAVSQQIVKLEQLVGKQLFHRGKMITLTNEGEVFLDYARQILKLHHEVFDHFQNPELNGDLNFGIPEDFASIFLQGVLTEFTQMHPKVSLHIDCDFSANLYKKFKENELDLVLIKTRESKEISESFELISEKLMWFGDGNLIRKGESIPLILSPDPCICRELVIEALENMNLKWHIAFSSHSYAGKLAATKAGIGITAMPNSMALLQISKVKSDILPELSNIYISLLKKKDLKNKAISSFEEFIIKHIG